jgi:DNA-directed RNA polymerase specialized sigma24 family protein
VTDETDIGGSNVRFPPTAWAVVRDAGAGSTDALGRLMAFYWKPAYFFIRRRGHDVEAAKDLTQGFFGSLLERDFFAAASSEKGKFRSYLLAALGHYLSNERDRARTQKRGGDWNLVEAEEELVASDPSPEKAFLGKWAIEILERAMSRLRLETTPQDLALLAGAAPPGLTETDRKNRRFRMRTRLRELLREEILPSVDRAEEVDSEIRELFSALE